ncbi:hypothetical protein [Streptomyces sp. NBC_01751]|uniref:hypothetical protein n=1 Tax=Streptomyces sp. NBC_01751 TaxID=2975929 RepID=UPI002DDBA19A|nr:hypothetical protein [Streptomyces sp. NBC_01751]WSD24537.1 hypothetical protein OHA26_14170 [Streptomyces sp. NBC_01751]
MTLELGIEDSGPIPVFDPKRNDPHVRHKEDVRHESALPDLYKLPRGFALGEFNTVVEGEVRLRNELLSLIDRCTEMVVDEDDETPGLLLIHTKAHSVDVPAWRVEYVDVITSDRLGNEGRTRLHHLAMALECRLMVAVERVSINRPHAQMDGSKSFKIVRYAKVLLS